MSSGSVIILILLVFLFYKQTSIIVRYVLAERPRTLEQHIERLESYIEVTKPPGDGPFPVALIFPNCLHTARHNTYWDRLLLQNGYTTIVVDSLGARRVGVGGYETTRKCGFREVRGFDVAGDIYALMEYLRGQEWADEEKVFLLGLSHGGWGIMDAMMWHEKRKNPYNVRGPVGQRLEGVHKIALFYPYCGYASAAYLKFKWDEPIPTLLIIAGRDEIVNPVHCERWYQAQDNDNIKRIDMKKALHGFDFPGTTDEPNKKYSQSYFDEAVEAMRELFSATPVGKRTR